MLKTLNSLYNDRIKKNGQNAYANNGEMGLTVRETHPELDEEANTVLKDKIVAVDFHGTIRDHQGNVIESMKQKLGEFKNAGYHIIVYTSGITRNPSILNGINQWLRDNGIPYDEIWARMGKPDADIYVDDKSFNPTKENINNLVVE